jgi:hypothetical protein
MVHVTPPLIGVLLVDKVLSQLLLYEDLSCFIDPSEQDFLAIAFVIEAVAFRTVSAWNCGVVD